MPSGDDGQAKQGRRWRGHGRRRRSKEQRQAQADTYHRRQSAHTSEDPGAPEASRLGGRALNQWYQSPTPRVLASRRWASSNQRHSNTMKTVPKMAVPMAPIRAPAEVWSTRALMAPVERWTWA